MSVYDHVDEVVKNWANMTRDPVGDDNLQVLWATSNSAVPFYPDSAQDLATRMGKKFPESQTPVLKYTDIYDDKMNPRGPVKTVAELRCWVSLNYHPA